MNECLKRRGLDVEQARVMLYGRIELPGFVRKNVWICPRDKSLNLKRFKEASRDGISFSHEEAYKF